MAHMPTSVERFVTKAGGSLPIDDSTDGSEFGM